ncbi:ESPR-type extended signal peptide-containing protein [Halomonas halodenitrificans]|uniref:ESPR-type extended signal peptide-containing protein n=1 Tax=Halomonas halodenitrificans TaxID=28252 RepID=UPI000487377D|nr:ESPR-type extended signal peptide-containing protein [Halomonas halodenitrificans]
MNKVFRIIWNSTLGRLVVASEAAQSKGKSSGQRLQVAPTAAVKASPAGVLCPLVVAIGLAAGAVITPAMLASADSEVKAGKNINVSEGTGGTGQAVYTVATKDDVLFNDLEVTNTALLGALQVTGQATLNGGLDMSSKQITGLAAGSAPNDAVNKSQLDSVQTTANQGWNVKANSGNEKKIGPGETLTFADGDSNIQISRDGNTIKVATSPNPEFTTVTTTGDATVGGNLNADGGLIVAGNQSVDMGGNKVTNVADGTGDSDAVNKSQLDDVQATASQGWKVQANGGDKETIAPGDTVVFTSGNNIEISRNGKAISIATSANPEFTTVKTTGDLTVGGELKANGGLSVANGQTVDMGGNAVTNVADGNVVENGNEAVATGQLWDLTEGGDGIKYFHANSTKNDSQANGTDSVAIGPTSIADGNNSFAAGLGAMTSGTADNGIALGNQASAGAGNSLAMGYQANAALESGTAIGNQAQARAENSIAVGKQTLALGENAISIGANGDPITALDLVDDDTNLTSINGVPVTATGVPLSPDGTYSPAGSNQITEIAGVPVDEAGVNQFIAALKAGTNLASGDNSLSLGVGTVAAGDSSVALGDRTTAADDAVGIGHKATAAGSAVGIGPGATAAGSNSFAGGNNAKVIGAGSNGVAIGNNSQAGHDSIPDPTTPGQTLDPSGKSAVAIGNGAQAQMDHDVAMGDGAGAGSYGLPSADISNVYIGRNAGSGVFAGGRNVAIGANAGKDRADDSDENVAIGNQAGLERGGNYNIALGQQAGGSSAKNGSSLSTDDTVSIGRKANASDSGALALGANAVASGENSLALGQETSTNSSGFIALGSGSVADKTVNAPSAGAYLTSETASSILSIGSGGPTGTTRRIVNVAGGELDTDAANVGQLKQLGDEVQGVFGDDVTVNSDGSLSFSRDGKNTLSAYLNENGAPGGGSGGTSGSNAVVYDGSSQDDITLADTQIHKVADGTSPTDAVNVRQLEEAGPHFVSVNTSKDDTNYDNTGASGVDAIAIGPTDGASGDSSLTIGRDAKAEEQYSLAIGERSNSKGQSAAAIGVGSRADADQSIAIGEASRVENQAGKTAANSGIAVGYKARVTLEHGSAIGESALSEAAQGQAFGYKAKVHPDAENANAIGNVAVVKENAASANAFGDQAEVSAGATSSTAIGTESNTSATNAYALGTQARSSGNSAYAQGNEARASATNAFALGSKKDADRTEASAKHAYAVGSGAQSKASRAYAIGADARANQATSVSGKDAFAIGTKATVNEDSAYAVGNKARSTAESGYAIGDTARSEKADSFAVGSNASTDGLNAYALGNMAKANGENAIAFGKGAITDTTAKNAIAFGTGSKASGENSLSFGTGSIVTGDNSGAFGDPNEVNATGAYAFGNDNTIDIDADNSFVLGNDVTLDQVNSVVLGNDSDTHEVNIGTAATESTLNDETRDYAGLASESNGFVSVGSKEGERQIHNVAAGQVSETSTDAINGSQLHATNQAVQQPITFEGDNGSGKAVERTLNTTLNVQGGASGTPLSASVVVTQTD